MRQGVVGEAFIDSFPAFEDDGYTKRSGLTDPADFDTTVWVEGVEIPLAVSIDEIDSSGEYVLGFIPPSGGFWKVEVLVDFSKEIWVSEVEVRDEDLDSLGGKLDNIMDGGSGGFVPADSLHNLRSDILRVLGLLHHNAVLDNQAYDEHGQMTSARLRVFELKSQVPSTPGGSETTGLLHEYNIEAVYDGAGVVKLYRLLRIQ